MAIRLKNLDLNVLGGKGTQQTNLGDITAVGTIVRPIFVAPVDCVVDSIDFYTRQTTLQSASNVSGINFKITVQQGFGGSSIQVRGNSASLINSDTWSAAQQYVLTPSANNSLSVNSVIEASINLCGSCVLSGVTVLVHYTKLTHRSTR